MAQASLKQGQLVSVTTRLRDMRVARGVSVADLARHTGVTRQTIYGIEDGTFVPNTTVALKLARALDVTVEELFYLAGERAPREVRADPLTSDHLLEGQPLRLCRVNKRLIAVPASFPPAYLPPADGVVGIRRKESVSIESPGDLAGIANRLLIAGCDPALSLLNEALRAPGTEIVSVPAPSRRALEWLKQGKVHVAGSHLLDRATGEYNVPIVRHLLPNTSTRIVTFATWEQGLVIARGNPKSIRSIADLAAGKVTIINREKGSGSRDLLDHGLRRFGIQPKAIKGYSALAEGHLAAAYAVASGTADCCIATRSAARCFGLDFMPLAVERFDLAIPKASFELPVAKAMLDLLNRSQLRKALQCVAGYDTAQTGRVVA